MKENSLRWRVCLLFALLLGCQKATGLSTTGNAKTFFPFQEGAKWQYAQRDPTSGRPQETFDLSFRGVQGVEKVGRDLLIVDEVAPQGVSPTGYFFQDGFLMKVLGLGYDKQGKVVWKGEMVRRDLGFASGNLEKFLPETITVGARWHNRTPILNALVETDYQVVGREEVEVPAGRYPECFRIESTMKVHYIPPDGTEDPEETATYSSSDWYAAEVGLVRSLVRQEEKDMGEIVLLRYEKGQERPSSR